MTKCKQKEFSSFRRDKPTDNNDLQSWGGLVFGTKSMSHHLLSLIHTNKLYFSVYISISVNYLENCGFQDQMKPKKKIFQTSTLMGRRRRSQGTAAPASSGAGLIIKQKLPTVTKLKSKSERMKRNKKTCWWKSR